MARSAAGAALAFTGATQGQHGADGHRLEAGKAAFDFSWAYPKCGGAAHCRGCPPSLVSFASHAPRIKERAR
jgi:hypothetical protein